MGAAKPAAAAILCLATFAAGVAQAGAARCWIDHGAVIASAAFGDIAGDFVLDLSRPASALHVTQANLDGIDADVATRPFEMAGERMVALTLPVTDLDAQLRAFDTAVAGVIGWDVLGRYAITLDLRHGCRLTLSSPRAFKGGLPLTLVGGAPAVLGAIADNLSSRAGLFWIDTGREASRIAGATLSRPPPKDGAPVRIRAISVGGGLFEQAPAQLLAGSPASAIGMAVWRGSIIRIDPTGRRMSVLWPGKRD